MLLTVLVAGACGDAPSLTAPLAAAQQQPTTTPPKTLPSAFDITVRFIGDGGTTVQRNAFAKAVGRWRQVITGQVSQIALQVPAGQCEPWIPAIEETIDDLLIYVRIRPIDGVGKVVGQASPCYVNSETSLPVMGFYELDQDDVNRLLEHNMLDDVVLHEMGHVLGIGTLWSYKRTLLQGAGTDDPLFVGSGAQQAFAAIPGNRVTRDGVPVENTGGTGTRDAHWRRSIFENELMQGYAQAGGMPMSRVTVRSLADLGYTVSESAADAFTLLTALRMAPSTPPISLGNDVKRVVIREAQ